MTSGPQPLLEAWTSDAAILRRWGDSHLADALETCAAELRTWWRERELELLSVEEATTLSGYTPDGLRKLVERGEMSDVREAGRRYYRRGELPRKAERRSHLTVQDGQPDLAARVLRSRREG